MLSAHRVCVLWNSSLPDRLRSLPYHYCIGDIINYFAISTFVNVLCNSLLSDERFQLPSPGAKDGADHRYNVAHVYILNGQNKTNTILCKSSAI